MKRREFIKTAAIGLGSLSLSRQVFAGAGKAGGRPNIIYIMSDDHASTTIGCYGGHFAEYAITPNIDKLAKQGVRMDRVYCTNSICVPSRGAILTGQYSHNNGIYGNQNPLKPEQNNVAKVLTAAGYETAIFGKWHLKEIPNGFTYHEVLKGQGKFFSPTLYTNEEPTQYEGGYSTDIITDRCINWLDGKRDKTKPFVLMCHYKSVHEPQSPPPRYEHLYEDVTFKEVPSLFEDKSHRSDGSREYGLTNSETRVMRETKPDSPNGQLDITGMTPKEASSAAFQSKAKDYLRCVAAIDENVGRLMKWLDDNGLADNTIIMYTADQGYFLGEHDYIDKRWMFEEAYRMPFIVRYPKLIKPGTTNKDLVLNIDFAPMMLDIVGEPTPDWMDGRSFKPVLAGNTPDDWRKRVYYRYWEHGNRPAHYGMRTEEYKLIFFYGLDLAPEAEAKKKKPGKKKSSKGAKPRKRANPTKYGWELYDLEKDPLEMQNVFNDPEYKDVAKDLKKQLFELKKEVGDTDEKHPELLKRLKG